MFCSILIIIFVSILPNYNKISCTYVCISIVNYYCTYILILAVGRREGIHQSVANEVAHIFRGKTAEQLDQLKIQIEKKICSKAEGVDIGYWETLLSQLKGMYNCRFMFYDNCKLCYYLYYHSDLC